MTQTSADKDPQTFALIGAAMETHRQLGQGFLEQVYHEAFAIELKLSNIPFTHETELPILYRGQRLQSKYRVDFVCFTNVLVEIKALGTLANNEVAQCINYLKASGMERCILLNFGASRLEYKRLVNSHKPSAVS